MVVKNSNDEHHSGAIHSAVISKSYVNDPLTIRLANYQKGINKKHPSIWDGEDDDMEIEPIQSAAAQEFRKELLRKTKLLDGPFMKLRDECEMDTSDHSPSDNQNQFEMSDTSVKRATDKAKVCEESSFKRCRTNSENEANDEIHSQAMAGPNPVNASSVAGSKTSGPGKAKKIQKLGNSVYQKEIEALLGAASILESFSTAEPVKDGELYSSTIKSLNRICCILNVLKGSNCAPDPVKDPEILQRGVDGGKDLALEAAFSFLSHVKHDDQNSLASLQANGYQDSVPSSNVPKPIDKNASKHHPMNTKPKNYDALSEIPIANPLCNLIHLDKSVKPARKAIDPKTENSISNGTLPLKPYGSAPYAGAFSNGRKITKNGSLPTPKAEILHFKATNTQSTYAQPLPAQTKPLDTVMDKLLNGNLPWRPAGSPPPMPAFKRENPDLKLDTDLTFKDNGAANLSSSWSTSPAVELGKAQPTKKSDFAIGGLPEDGSSNSKKEWASKWINSVQPESNNIASKVPANSYSNLNSTQKMEPIITPLKAKTDRAASPNEASPKKLSENPSSKETNTYVPSPEKYVPPQKRTAPKMPEPPKITTQSRQQYSPPPRFAKREAIAPLDYQDNSRINQNYKFKENISRQDQAFDVDSNAVSITKPSVDLKDAMISLKICDEKSALVDELMLQYVQIAHMKRTYRQLYEIVPDAGQKNKAYEWNASAVQVLLRSVFNLHFKIPSWEIALEAFALAEKFGIQKLQDICSDYFNEKTIQDWQVPGIVHTATKLRMKKALRNSMMFAEVKHSLILEAEKQQPPATHPRCYISCTVNVDPSEFCVPLMYKEVKGLGGVREVDLKNEIVFEAKSGKYCITKLQIKLEAKSKDLGKRLTIFCDAWREGVKIFDIEKNKHLSSLMIIDFEDKPKLMVGPGESAIISVTIEGVCLRMIHCIQREKESGKCSNGSFEVTFKSGRKNEDKQFFFFVEKLFYIEE